jgi:hypothetical protein
MTGNSNNNRRDSDRQLRPLSCEIELEGKVHSGVIRDLSRQGLFVTSRFEASLGAPVTVRVRRPGGEIWEIQATTARNADGSQALISRRGLGLVIDEAPAAFHEFVAELEGGDHSGPLRWGGPDEEAAEEAAEDAEQKADRKSDDSSLNT